MTASPSRSPRRQPHHLPGSRSVLGRLATAARLLSRLIQGLVATAILGGLLIGLPWALWHYIGWPLPDHVPTWVELQIVLMSPMTGPELLNILAIACWLIWAVFAADVARCVIAAVSGAHWPDPATTGPIRATAAALIGAITLTLLGQRTITNPVHHSTAATTTSAVVATAPAWHPTGDGHTVADATQTASGSHPSAHDANHTPVPPGSVMVQAPHDGVHDSLWRIADRELGDGTRWPEIFAVNQGKPQPHGGRLTRPSLISPGDILALPLPHITQPPATPPGGRPNADRPPTPATGTPVTAPARPLVSPATEQHRSRRRVGISWNTEVFLGVGLAAAVSAALTIARHRYRQTYQPGSGRRDDLPLAPVVYRLQLAHLNNNDDTPDPDDPDTDDPDSDDGSTTATPHARSPRQPAVVIDSTAGARPDSATGAAGTATSVGVRDGREIAVDLAAVHGLGLLGAGTPAAARALLVALLAPATDDPAHAAPAWGTVIVPRDVLALLLDGEATHLPRPTRLRIVPDLDTAVDAVETETLRRARAREHTPERDGRWPVLALVARPTERTIPRLQAVLDNGAHLGIVGILLGQWRRGVTAYIRAEGTVSATSPGGEPLRGTRMFRLPEPDTADLLHLLHRAQPHPLPTHTINNAINNAIDDAIHGVDDDLDAAVAATPDQQPASGPPHHPPHQHGQRHTDSGGRGEITSDQTQQAPRGSAAIIAELRPDPSEADTAPPIRITVLGTPRVYWQPPDGGGEGEGHEREITGAFPPRVRELLVFLGLHPDGATRESLVAALWAHIAPHRRPTNAANTTLSRLRTALATTTHGTVTDITLAGNGRYQLDPTLVHVDYWRFADAVDTRRAATTDAERVTAYREIVNSYGGEVAEGMTAEWIQPVRVAIQCEFVDAVVALARAVADHDPQQALALLETARAFDPRNELLYRNIMRLQHRLGRADAIPRTLGLLTTRLTEIGDQPTPHIVQLATQLRDRATTPSRSPASNHHRQDSRDRHATH